MNGLTQNLEEVVQQVSEIWTSGGWCMFPIAATAFGLFALGARIYLKLRDGNLADLGDKNIRDWARIADSDGSPIRQVLAMVSKAASVKEATNLFSELRMHETATVERDLKVMRVCISAAPLLGLLGTVTGMLATFTALGSGPGGEQTMGLVAKGIAEALITTETGLVVALPGVFLHYQLARKLDQLKLMIAHLETVSTQAIYNQLRAS